MVCDRENGNKGEKQRQREVDRETGRQTETAERGVQRQRKRSKLEMDEQKR